MSKKQGSIVLMLATMFFLLFQVGRADAFSLTEFINSLLQRNQPAQSSNLGADAIGSVSAGTPTSTQNPTPLLPGCTATSLFSTTTGQACNGSGVTLGNLVAPLTKGLALPIPSVPVKNQASSCKTSFFTETLKVGQKDNQVKALQAILIDAGYLLGTADGSFGPKTAAALRAYQKANGVAVVGYVGSTTRAKLNAVWKNECLGSDESLAADATIKADLTNASAQAVMYHDANNLSYTGVCTPGALVANVHGVAEMVLAAANLSGITSVTTNGTGTTTSATCNESGTAWAAEAPLKDSSLYCVDSTGAAKEEKTSIGSGTACL